MWAKLLPMSKLGSILPKRQFLASDQFAAGKVRPIRQTLL
jgi:hypothetical protein